MRTMADDTQGNFLSNIAGQLWLINGQLGETQGLRLI